METYDIDLEKGSSAQKVVDKLRVYGAVRIVGYTNKASIIKKELMEIYDSMEPNYQYGKAIRTDHSDTWCPQKTPSVVDFFNNQWMFDIASNYQTLQNGFEKDLFSTYDYLHNNGTGPQGWAHFDKLQRFKFFLNVTNIDKQCGPLCLAPGTHTQVKKLRNMDPTPNDPRRWRFGRFFGDDGLCGEDDWKEGAIDGSQNHYPDIRYELQPMIGPEGTLIIFDSDVIHKGGGISKGKERIVVRSHLW